MTEVIETREGEAKCVCGYDEVGVRCVGWGSTPLPPRYAGDYIMMKRVLTINQLDGRPMMGDVGCGKRHRCARRGEECGLGVVVEGCVKGE